MLACPDLVPGSGRPARARSPTGPPRPRQNMGPRRPCPRNPNGHQGSTARIQRNRVTDKAPTFVGIDVSKHRLDIHSRPSGESFATDYDDEGVAALVERLAALAPTLVVLEATGGLEGRLAGGPAAGGPPVAVVNPRQVRAFARATGRLAKTDRLDAATIARFAEAVRPPVRPLPDEATRHLGALVGRRGAPRGGGGPPAPRAPGWPPAVSCSRCWSPSATGATRPIPPCTRGSTPTCAGSRRRWPGSSATWARRSGRARSGGPRRSCCARCRASGP